jgi:hypothetical protein
LVIFCPMVLIIRQPPLMVPKAIAACAASTTQSDEYQCFIPTAKDKYAEAGMGNGHTGITSNQRVGRTAG